MSWEEDVKILNESAAFAIEVFAKPLGIESVDQREHLTFLQEKLAETEKDSAYRYIVSRRAPMLLTAIKGALDARRLADGTLAAGPSPRR